MPVTLDQDSIHVERRVILLTVCQACLAYMLLSDGVFSIQNLFSFLRLENLHPHSFENLVLV